MDKAALLTERLPRADVEIEGVGTVTVRGLSRYELLLAGKGAEETDTATVEQKMLAMAMVDPELSVSEVAAWQRAAPAGEIQPIVMAINELSGVTKSAQKEAYKSVREEPGA